MSIAPLRKRPSYEVRVEYAATSGLKIAKPAIILVIPRSQIRASPSLVIGQVKGLYAPTSSSFRTGAAPPQAFDESERPRPEVACVSNPELNQKLPLCCIRITYQP